MTGGAASNFEVVRYISEELNGPLSPPLHITIQRAIVPPFMPLKRTAINWKTMR